MTPEQVDQLITRLDWIVDGLRTINGGLNFLNLLLSLLLLCAIVALFSKLK